MRRNSGGERGGELEEISAEERVLIGDERGTGDVGTGEILDDINIGAGRTGTLQVLACF